MTSPYIHSENVHNTKAAREMLPTVLAAYPANSVVDFGTGLGTWLQVAKELGVEDVLGIDGDWVQPEQLAIPVEQFLAKSLHEEIRLGRRSVGFYFRLLLKSMKNRVMDALRR